MLIFEKEMIGKAKMETFLEMIMCIARARTGGDATPMSPTRQRSGFDSGLWTVFVFRGIGVATLL